MRLRWLALGFVAAGMTAACGGSSGGSSDTTGAGAGPGGTGGTASAGKGGASGKGGAAAGASGKGGATAGSAGQAAGGAGTGGATGGAGGATGGSGGGKAGSAGATAGSAGTAGAAGATGGKGGSAGAAAGSAGSGGAPVVTTCVTSTECANNPMSKICDPTTNTCVGCLPSNDTCPANQYCKVSTQQCSLGCKGDKDCSGMTPHCDLGTNTCHQCLTATDCPAGNICSKGSCAVGCDAAKPCTTGTCCGDSACHDLKTDINNCGGCGKACVDPPNAKGACVNMACGLSACQPGFFDCNGDPSDGCESNTMCVCSPGATSACYTGDAATKGKGMCKDGVQVCAPSGLGYVPGCLGEVLPTLEQCDGKDHDCDGTADNPPDVDGDGWNACQGDCCEDTTQCGTPATVNPGAYDIPADMTDNDCDGGVDNPLACVSSAKLANVAPQDGATAIELCQTTTASPPLPQKKWGVLNAQWLLADGSVPSAQGLSDIQNWQAAILTNYGSGPTDGARKGSTLLGMSNGKMRTPSLPGWPGTPSTSFTTAVQPPAIYTGAHGGNLLPGKCGNTTCPVGTGANDSVNLRLSIRVPTNAPSFTYDFRFFSMEYQTYQCTLFNDYFLALITTGAAGIPADHNISFDANGSAVSVNNGFFQVCGGNGKNCGTCPNGTADLAGTGMDGVSGGGTAWLTTKAPVVPGETMTLDVTVFDVQDHILDSLVLVDNWQWLATPSGPPTTNPAK
jgi:hypothetical protein